MIKAARTMVIDRPIADVFAFVGDQTNAPQWQAGLTEVRRLTDGPPGIGTRHSIVRTFMGRRTELENEYVVFEPDRLITFRAISGSMPLEASYIFEPAGTGTKLTSAIAMQAAGFVALAEPLIAAGLRREMRANFARLRELLEGPAPARASESALA
jgi:uncharacterized protein YndB with AHSA1/START domain